MSVWDHPPLHDFPDRAFRRLLTHPGNLRDLLAVLLPDQVDHLDFSRLEELPRSFLLDDWRRREADLLFRLPWLPGTTDVSPLLVCLLVEHQSEADPAMPLRLLLYAALHWQTEWHAWVEAHPEGEPLRLTPIVPIIFHTGGTPWRTFRTLAALIRGPAELAGFAPAWEPRFWELAEHPTAELLGAVGEFLVALAVVRAERTSSEAFRAVLTGVLQRLEGLSEQDRVRWEGLIWFVLSWALRRRPGEEREALLEAVRKSQAEVRHQEEVGRMSETIVQTWEQELVARGEARGQLQECRQTLRVVLEERFGALPEALVRQIEGIDDLERLRSALRRALHVGELTQLEL